MPTNKRIYYACYAAGIAKDGFTSYTPIHGLQQIGITTTFNLERVSEIGQIETYELIENVPDVEVTLEKVLDGYPPIYVLATQQGTSASLAGRGSAKCSVAMSIFDETLDSASGTPLTQVEMSGLFVSSLAYTFPSDGNCTESVTLIGSHKKWKTSSFTFSGQLFTNTDQPLALTSGTGGVQRRENIQFVGPNYTILPGGTAGGIPGISSSGTNDKVTDVFGAHVQRIGASVNLGRTPIFELGRRNFYHRYIEFPVEVTTEIEILDINGDNVDALENGTDGSGNNVSNKQIRIKLEEGMVLDLGTKNKLQSVSWGNAGADGGNATSTFNYLNYNSFKVTHPQDPSALS